MQAPRLVTLMDCFFSTEEEMNIVLHYTLTSSDSTNVCDFLYCDFSEHAAAIASDLWFFGKKTL